MNRTSLSIFVSILSLGISSFAQEGERKRPGGEGRPPHPILTALDADEDGSLQQSEIDMAVVALRKLDKDGDGTVSADEIRPAGGPPTGSPGGDRPGGGRGPGMDALDKDKDGKISKEEAPDRMKERFDQIDANADGFVDKSEMEKLMARIREIGGKGRGDKGKGDKGKGKGGKGAGGGEEQGGGVKPKRPALEE